MLPRAPVFPQNITGAVRRYPASPHKVEHLVDGNRQLGYMAGEHRREGLAYYIFSFHDGGIIGIAQAHGLDSIVRPSKLAVWNLKNTSLTNPF